jgi:hypothetical protein
MNFLKKWMARIRGKVESENGGKLDPRVPDKSPFDPYDPVPVPKPVNPQHESK